MRYSKEHKAETHARIVKTAAMRFREKGARGVGVADLMKEAGLTHGGFYAHFDSREALLIEALASSMERGLARWRKRTADAAPEDRLAAIVTGYLSTAHRDDPGHGCSIPALGADAVREGPKVRKALASTLDDLIVMIAEQIPGEDRKAARKQAVATLATMVGAILMSRVAGTGEFSNEILDVAREHILQNAPAQSD